LFGEKVSNVFNFKSGRSKLVSTRRSTGLSLPFQLVFLGLAEKEEKIEKNELTSIGH
jgi:hypothetical protein